MNTVENTAEMNTTVRQDVTDDLLIESNPDFAMPEGLDASGQKAYEIIIAYLKEHGMTHTGGCTTFYAPEAWKARGEEYGTRSHLVVVYDGSEVRRAFNMDACLDTHEMFIEAAREFGMKDYKPGNAYAIYEGLQDKLREARLYFEECTGWYAAIYTM